MTGEQFVGWVVQASVVIAGWYVVHRLSVTRDRDKARRDTIVDATDTLSEMVSALLSEARAYHCGDRSVSKELLIKMAIQDLSLHINSLADIFPDTATLAQCRSKVGSLRRAITGMHFEDEHVEPLEEGHAQHQVMAESALELKRALMRVRNQQLLP